MAFFGTCFYRDTFREELPYGYHMDPMGQNAKKTTGLAWKDSCHGVGNPSGVGISKDQEPHATQLQRNGFIVAKLNPKGLGWGYMDIWMDDRIVDLLLSCWRIF